MPQASAEISEVMRGLSRYISSAVGEDLPPEVSEKGKHHLLDTLAAMISGSRLRPGKAAIQFVASQGGREEACVAGTSILTTAINAALANGMLAHADETDDSHKDSRCHPGCGIVPGRPCHGGKRGPRRRSPPAGDGARIRRWLQNHLCLGGGSILLGGSQHPQFRPPFRGGRGGRSLGESE